MFPSSDSVFSPFCATISNNYIDVTIFVDLLDVWLEFLDEV
jgi:hypothetical protein